MSRLSRTASRSIHVLNRIDFRDFLVQQLINLPQAYQIAVTDDRGQLVVSTAAWPTPDVNVADRDYFKELVGQ